MKKIFFIISICSLMSCSANLVQQHPVIGSERRCLQNSHITYMIKNKVSTDVILSSINNNCCHCFETDPQSLVALIEQGVPNIVTKRMIQLNNPKLKSVRVNARTNGPRSPF